MGCHLPRRAHAAPPTKSRLTTWLHSTLTTTSTPPPGTPSKFRRLAWHKWLFSLQSRKTTTTTRVSGRMSAPHAHAPIVTCDATSVYKLSLLTAPPPTAWSTPGYPPGHGLLWLLDGAALRSTATCASVGDSLCLVPSMSTCCSPWVGREPRRGSLVTTINTQWTPSHLP